jgi:ParB-like chromosome segregation protein Spo0J
MTIEPVPLSAIREYPTNPRVISDRAVDAVANSIKTFGFLVPCVIDADNVLVAGHTRTRAARKLGMAEVPCVRVTNLTEAQLRAFRVADNATAAIAEWDDALLAKELAALEAVGFDLGTTGFDEAEVENLLYPEGRPGQTDADEVPPVPVVPVTKRGDLWLLGAHTTCPHCNEVNPL